MKPTCIIAWDSNGQKRPGLKGLLFAGLFCISGLLLAQNIGVAPLDPDATGSLIEAGHMVDSGSYSPAVALLTAYLQTNRASVEGHRLLAYSYLRLNDPKHSLEQYTAAAAIEQPRALDLQNVAKAYVLLGDLASAEHWVKTSLSMNEDDADGWYELGRIQYTQQHLQDAVDCFQRSLSLLPQSVKSENNLGLAYQALNQDAKAEAAYRQAIAWQQHSAHPSEQPLLNLSIMLIHREKFDEAAELLKEALAIAPRDPQLREQLGHLYLQTNQLQLAQEQLQAAIQLQPDKPALHFLLGRVYHLQGQQPKAKAEFALAASLSGEHATPSKF